MLKMEGNMNNNDSNTSWQISQTRNELNNIRKMLQGMKAQYKHDIKRLEEMLTSFKLQQGTKDNSLYLQNEKEVSSASLFEMKPIGYMKSIYNVKNGTPRQGSISSLGRGRFEIEKLVFNNPQHSLDGLKQYSHLWIIYIFNQNSLKKICAKVSPPRLDGKRVGVFSTRSPNRPNAIGLTLAKLEKIEDACVHLSGIDILDGTPILDIKPYIPSYDNPSFHCDKTNLLSQPDDSLETSINDVEFPNTYERSEHLTSKNEVINNTLDKSEVIKQNKFCDQIEHLNSSNEISDSGEVTLADWLNDPPTTQLRVIFNPIAIEQMKQFSAHAENSEYRLEYLQNDSELKMAISSVLAEDPRSAYRRQKCTDRLYYFMVDVAHISVCFFESVAEVLRVNPASKVASSFNLV